MALSYFFLTAMFLPSVVAFSFIKKQKEIHPSLENFNS